MDIHGYSAHVLVNGRKVKEYRHKGLTFIEAKNGTEFAIEVKSHLSGRVIAIVSVDGIDIVDGKPATNKSRGYILSGNSAQSFHGWRRNENEVANFQFTTKDNSYATEKGKGENNGIIAVKLIAEKIRAIIPAAINWPAPAKDLPPHSPYFPPYFPTPKRPRPYWDDMGYSVCDTTGNYSLGGTSMRCSASLDNSSNLKAASFSANYCSVAPSEVAPEFDMGTTWGSLRTDKVVETEFEYGNEIATLEFYYASREALQAMGIPLIEQKQITRLPQAFEGKSYAQPPKNWRA